MWAFDMRMRVIYWDLVSSQSSSVVRSNEVVCERENYITRQPPTREKEDYDSSNFWISGALPSRTRKEKGRRGKKDERPTQRHIVASDVSEERSLHSTGRLDGGEEEERAN